MLQLDEEREHPPVLRLARNVPLTGLQGCAAEQRCVAAASKEFNGQISAGDEVLGADRAVSSMLVYRGVEPMTR